MALRCACYDIKYVPRTAEIASIPKAGTSTRAPIRACFSDVSLRAGNLNSSDSG